MSEIQPIQDENNTNNNNIENDNNNNNENIQTEQTQTEPHKDSKAILANGLYLLLSPVVKECDAKIQEVYYSQKALSDQIDSLSRELDEFNNNAQVPPLLPHIQKLLNARGRLLAVNSKLSLVMSRLEKLSTSINQQQQQALSQQQQLEIQQNTHKSVSDRISSLFSGKKTTPTTSNVQPNN
ncbi:hypothetical protein DICPUDRAFT_152229 [Dictyostelium purpureum]|uniref:Biogenesis of lysosome-related organelles complex 1 subunit 7 n=1 Tax=Dictyostelium purpureum TaxID=5786 RepID=F0ZKT3_DICPU|nr:uncharacterized protein DICPUDRAFT_152229 [Dictyostelium purpureum]EGC35434.1 hypothetical protein DICPUDRAFT_152229 [Dictyostelium purpureum]|eukprot:XP_003288047.1 hypothetical protein DICPUDRAFT_152229 [Dictyostelium purpureum]